MAVGIRQQRTGSEDTLATARLQRTTVRLSDAANLTMGTWNCGGLTKVKKDMCIKIDLDIMCITETHTWHDDDPNSIYSDAPSKEDSWSGVSLILNRRISKYVISSGAIGSRIVYCRLRGLSCNIYVVGVYIPQKKRVNPDQNDTYTQLESLLLKISHRDCIILMGDFNSRLSRNTPGRVGRWCIHNKRDSGGDRLLNIMNTISFKCVSTYFQPRRKHNNATFMNVQCEKPPSQIDYILVSSRWASSVRNCQTKWGITISAYGRKYDHALIQMKLQLRLKCDRRSQRKDFNALKTPAIARSYDENIRNTLNSSARPTNATDQWNRLAKTMQAAQQFIPNIKRANIRKWETSATTLSLVKERAQNWEKVSEHQRTEMNKGVSRSARDDYRNYVNGILEDIEEAEESGNSSGVFRLAKCLSTKRRGNSFVQPTTDLQGNIITSTEQQLEAWAIFLEDKFAARADETTINLHCGPDEKEEEVPDITFDEIKACIKQLKSGKASGPDAIPIEQFKASESAVAELFQVLTSIWKEEEIPDNLVLAEMLLHYKKKCKNDRSNYRALGLLNHGYKIFAMVLLLRMIPYITPKLSDMQAGFRKGRGCRDNIMILVMTVHHLLNRDDDDAGIITYIDFSAAFDSILHSYLFKALKQYGVPLKYCRLVNAIYKSAAVQVRLQEPGGSRAHSRNINIRRGVLQGDIPSPLCFLVALDKLLKDHGDLDSGILVKENLLSALAFADDAALPTKDTDSATRKLTNLSVNAEDEAGMKISISKTKVQHIRAKPRVSETTEEDIKNLPPEKKFKYECDKCGMTYPTKHGLSVHQGRWCKKRKTAKKPSRKGTVADKIITRQKVEKHQGTLSKVKIGTVELENVYSFVYLGAELAGDGDPEVTVKHRCDIAWGRFGEYRKVLLSGKLPVNTRIRLYTSLIISTMIYGSSAWLMTKKVKQKVNGVSSKMLSLITKRSIYEEARAPTVSVVELIMKRRWEYLGHILRMDENRALRCFLIDLSPREPPYIEGSLFDDTNYENVDMMIADAANRDHWRIAWKTRRRDLK